MNEHRALISDLLARVAQLCDHGEVEEYLDLYLADGVWELTGNPHTGIGPTVRNGHEAIRSGVEERRALRLQGPGTHALHVVTTTSIDFDGPNDARARSHWLYFTEIDKAPLLNSAGIYDDHLHLVDGSQWKIAHRRAMLG